MKDHYTVKNVGELIAALKQMPPETPFVEGSSGYYRINRQVELYLSPRTLALEKVHRGEIVIDGQPALRLFVEHIIGGE